MAGVASTICREKKTRSATQHITQTTCVQEQPADLTSAPQEGPQDLQRIFRATSNREDSLIWRLDVDALVILDKATKQMTNEKTKLLWHKLMPFPICLIVA